MFRSILSTFAAWFAARDSFAGRRRYRKLRADVLERRELLATIIWDLAGGGNWHTASNWDLDRLPQAGDDVVINNLSAGQVINLTTTTPALNSVTATSRLSVNSGGVLEVTGLVQAAGGVLISGGTLKNTTTDATTTVILTTAGGTLQAVTVNGTLDATTNNARATITQDLMLNGTATLGDGGLLNFNGTQTLAGSGGTVSFNPVSFGANGLIASAHNMTLTIGAGITIQGGANATYGSSIGASTYYSGSGNNTSIINYGTIVANRVGASIRVAPNGGTLTNLGQLSVNGGNLVLGGNMTIASLGVLTPGRLTHAGGSGNFLLSGILNNTNTTLPLSAAIGSWHLNGGTIQGGNVTAADSTKLYLANANNSLNQVTLDCELDGTTTNARATITNGLTLNNLVTLGDGGLLFFNGTQTLGGTGGTVMLNPTTFGANGLIASANNMTLTIGAGITIRGGANASFASSIGASTYYSGSGNNTSIINHGTIVADRVGATIWVNPNGGSLTNLGQLAVNGGNLGLGGNTTIGSLGLLTPGRLTHAGGSGNFHLTGTLNNTNTTLPLSAAIGSWYLNGGTIQGGNVTAAGGSKLYLTNNASNTLNQVTLDCELDGMTTNARATITNGLTLNNIVNLADGGLLFFNGTQTLGGTGGTVIFNPVSFGANGLIASANNMTLTIGAGITIHGGANATYGSSIGASTYYSGSGNNTSIINQGTVVADRVGATIWVAPNGGTLTNLGQLAVNGGNLGLGGNMTIASLGILTPGRLTHAGGSGAFHLRGILNNANTTLPLSAAIGSWYLNGGTIQGGTVSTIDGTRLYLSTAAANTLTGVTITGDLAATDVNAQATINGLTLNGGNVTLGDGARLNFNGTQTLAGTNGTVVLNQTSLFQSNALLSTVANMTLTIGEGITVIGGTTSSYGSSIGGSAYFAAGTNTSIINQGTIIADGNGRQLSIRPTGTGTFVNSKTISSQNGGVLQLEKSFTAADPGTLTETPASAVQFSGDLLTTTTSLDRFHLPGNVTMRGNGLATSPFQLLEAPAQDLGNIAAGYVNNFAFGSLVLANRARVRLVNLADNAAGTGAEAVYTDSLNVPSDSVLDLNGLNLYTRSFVIPTPSSVIGGSVILIPDGGIIPLGVPASGNISTAGQVDQWSFLAGPSTSITIVVNPGSGGLNLSNARVQLVDPNGTVIGDLSNSISGGVITLNQSNFTIAGTYSVRISATVAEPSSVGNYSVTIWDSTPFMQAIVVNQTYAGNILSPFTVNRWTFSALPGHQVQLDLLTASTSGLLFTLFGPNNEIITGINGIGGDSALITLHASETYTLEVISNGTAMGNYSFQMLRPPYVPLQVTFLTPTSTGFVATFNRNLNPSGLNLYDTEGGGIGAADVTLLGLATGLVRGSVAVDANLRRLTFIATTGRLPVDTYTVTLRSAPNGFVDAFGYLLDGDFDGLFGADYTTNFTVAGGLPNTVTISLPNFARGPQQAVHLPAATMNGIPLTFSDASGITSATLQLRYDPSLLTITAASVAPGLPTGAQVTLSVSTPGIAEIQFNSATPLSAGATTFVRLQASVPITATYRSKHILDLSNIVLNGGSIPGIDDDAVHVAAYFGDTTGNGTYSAQDASRLMRLAIGLDSGLQLFQLLEPTIIADVSGNNAISSTDTSRVLQASVGNSVPELPLLPSPAVSLIQGGPDPKLSIPTDLVAMAGGSLQIPVLIDSIVDLTGNGLESADLVIYYDATALDVSSVSLGSLFAGQSSSWIVAARIDPLAGRIFVSLAGQRPFEGFFQGELVQLQATVKADANPGVIAINLAASSRDPARYTQLDEGYLTLIPAPTDAANDPGVDGAVTILTNPVHTSTDPLASVQLVNDRLLISGTTDNDRIFVGLTGANQIRVRIDHQVLGDFPKPAGILIQGQGGLDLVTLAAGIRSTDVELASDPISLAFTLLLSGRVEIATEPSSSPIVAEQHSRESFTQNDLALLRLMEGWTERANEQEQSHLQLFNNPLPRSIGLERLRTKKDAMLRWGAIQT